MANPDQRAREHAANSAAQRRHREVQKFATYTRQQRRRVEFLLGLQDVTSRLDLPRNARRKIARAQLKTNRAASKAA